MSIILAQRREIYKYLEFNPAINSRVAFIFRQLLVIHVTLRSLTISGAMVLWLL